MCQFSMNYVGDQCFAKYMHYVNKVNRSYICSFLDKFVCAIHFFAITSMFLNFLKTIVSFWLVKACNVK